MNFIVNLPVEVSILVASKWLPLTSLVRLDSAMGESRPNWLNMLRKCQLGHSVYEDGMLRSAFMNWLQLRWIANSHLLISELENVRDYVNAMGKHITHVCLNSSNEDKTSIVHATLCPNLASITCVNCTVDGWLLHFLSECPSVHSVEIADCVVSDSCSPGAFPLTNIASLEVDWPGSMELVTEFVHLCPALRRLVVYNLPRGSPLERFVRTCATLTSIECLTLHSRYLTDAHLIQIVSQCEKISELNVSTPLGKRLTDTSIVFAAEHLKRLHTLVVSETGITVVSLKAIATHCKATMRRLYVATCRKISNSALRAFLTACPLVATIGFALQQVCWPADDTSLRNITSLAVDCRVADWPVLIPTLCPNLERLHLGAYPPGFSFLDNIVARCVHLKLLRYEYAGYEDYEPMTNDIHAKLCRMRPGLKVFENRSLSCVGCEDDNFIMSMTIY